MKRYYELVLSGRQLALLLAVFTALLLLAFGLGVAVGLLQPGKQPAAVATEGIVSVSEQSAKMGQSQGQPTAAFPPLGVAVEPTPTPPPSLLEEKVMPASPTPEFTAPKATVAPSPPIKPIQKSGVWVQVAAVREKRDAEGIRQRVIAQGFLPNQVKFFRTSEGKYRVRVGPFPDKESGSRVTQRLRAAGFPNAFLVMQ